MLDEKTKHYICLIMQCQSWPLYRNHALFIQHLEYAKHKLPRLSYSTYRFCSQNNNFAVYTLSFSLIPWYSGNDCSSQIYFIQFAHV